MAKEGIAALGVALLGTLGAGQVAAQPVLKLDKNAIELPAMQPGTKETVSFTFTNTGTRPLVIQKVKTQCGCTVARYSRRPIAPGERGEVRAVFRAGKDTRGYLHKTVTVVTNEGSEPRYLNFTVRVLEPQ